MSCATPTLTTRWRWPAPAARTTSCFSWRRVSRWRGWGRGETVFVQGIARGRGFDGSVSSKSFVLMGEYRGRDCKLYHADLYRLDTPEQAEELAVDEYCADGVLVAEWPERAPHVFPIERLHVRFEVTAERGRRLGGEGGGG